jgi:hypothetical protein
MRKLVAVAFGVGALLILSMPAGVAKSSINGVRKQSWHHGPETCVHVRFLRSRQTRYVGAPRCRRIYG